MTFEERILQTVQALPESVQAQVLDFVEYLEAKVRAGKKTQEEADWSVLSLSQAMRGLESEPSAYSIEDLKENFS